MLPLIQARPELRLWHLSVLIAVLSGAMMALAFTRFDEHPALIVTIERTAAFVPIFGISLTGLLWAFASPQRWSELDLVLPAPHRMLRRSRLIASWVATLAPATLGFVLLATVSSWVRESILPELGATLAALVLFATLQATLPRRRSMASAWIHCLSTVAFAAAVLLGTFVSPLAATLASLGISAVLTFQQWNCADPILCVESAAEPGGSFRTRWTAGRIGLAALQIGMLVLVSWSGAAPGAFSSALWLPWVLLGVQGVIFLELRSIRSLGWLPLDRRRIALRAVFVSLAILAAGAGVSYAIIDTPLSWSHREAKLRLDYDSAAQRWFVQLTPPIDLYELVEAPAPQQIEEPPLVPSSEQESQDREATGLGYYRRNPYELRPQDRFEEVLATTERLVRDIFGEHAPVERITKELLQEDAQGLATLRVERPSPDILYELFADQGLRGNRAAFAFLWLVIFGLWLLGTWTATTPRSLPARKLHPMGLSFFASMLLLPLLIFFNGERGEVLAIWIRELGEALWSWPTLVVIAALIVLHVRLLIPRVERMEAVLWPADRKSWLGDRHTRLDL